MSQPPGTTRRPFLLTRRVRLPRLLRGMLWGGYLWVFGLLLFNAPWALIVWAAVVAVTSRKALTQAKGDLRAQNEKIERATDTELGRLGEDANAQIKASWEGILNATTPLWRLSLQFLALAGLIAHRFATVAYHVDFPGFL